MAHADYDCCAICDSKQSYNSGDSNTKKEICSTCLHLLRDNGINALNPQEFITWVKQQELEVIKDKLEKIGFSLCYYNNDVDLAITERLPKFPK